MTRKKIAIACQGGGAQTAFTAGVLISLLKNMAYDKNHIVSLSGTSGGAICAVLAWQGLLKWDNGDRNSLVQSLESFWLDNGTENMLERLFNDSLIHYLQLLDHGFLPEWKTSPYSPWWQAWVMTLQLFLPQFFDLKGLLKKHIDFDWLDKNAGSMKSPILVVGAADVQTGEFKKFNSLEHNINIDSILASAAVPTLSKAVETGGGVYWDGLFSDNPPTDELIDDEIVSKDNIPDQLWVIQINPKRSESIPKTTEEILDRRNEMIGNASLYQDLQHICRINKWLRRGAFKEDYQSGHNLKIVDIYVIQMSEGFQKSLTYASKLDRDGRYIQELIAHGEERGRQFLGNPESMRFDPVC